MRRMMMVMMLGLLLVGVPGVQAECNNGLNEIGQICSYEESLNNWRDQEMARIAQENTRRIESFNREWNNQLQLEAQKERAKRDELGMSQGYYQQRDTYQSDDHDRQVRQQDQRRYDDFDRQQRQANERLHHDNDARDAAKKSFKYR